MKTWAKSLMVLLLLTGCLHARQTAETQPQAVQQNVLEFNATVVYVTVEGGFYGLTDAEGKAYDPINLPPEFRKDGMKVRVSARPRTDMAGFHMWGTIIEILSIEQE